jgi:hypothetical protein
MGVSISIDLYEAKVELERFATVEKERSFSTLTMV